MESLGYRCVNDDSPYCSNVSKKMDLVSVSHYLLITTGIAKILSRIKLHIYGTNIQHILNSHLISFQIYIIPYFIFYYYTFTHNFIRLTDI